MQNELASLQAAFNENKKELTTQREKFLRQAQENLTLSTKLDAKAFEKDTLEKEKSQLSDKMQVTERELAEMSTRHNE